MNRAVSLALALSLQALALGSLLLACQGRAPAKPDPRAEGTHASDIEPAPSAAAMAPATAPKSTTSEATAPEQTAAKLGKVYLQELGDPLPPADLEFVLRSLAYFFPNQVEVLPPRELPKVAYYPPRSRYRAEKLLDDMVARTPADAQVMVGLTTVDISTTKGDYEDWGILGLATVSGRECVISRFRAARGAQNDLHVSQRLAKVVVHEIGHTLGLVHCPEFGCLMEDGKGSVLTTDHELDFCSSCRQAVGARLLPASGPLPWDPPAHSP